MRVFKSLFEKFIQENYVYKEPCVLKHFATHDTCYSDNMENAIFFAIIPECNNMKIQ